MWPKTRLLKKLMIDGFGDGKVYIDPNQIHKLERPHRKAIGFHNAVDLLMRGNAIAQHTECFTIKIPGNPIDDKSRRIFREDWNFADLLDIAFGAVHHIVGRFLPAHDFDELHDMRRIEKVQSEHALGPPASHSRSL